MHPKSQTSLFDDPGTHLSLHGAWALHCAIKEFLANNGHAPWNAYHRPKADAEAQVLQAHQLKCEAWVAGLSLALQPFHDAVIAYVHRPTSNTISASSESFRLYLDTEEARLDAKLCKPTCWWHGLPLHEMPLVQWLAQRTRCNALLERFAKDIYPFSAEQMPAIAPHGKDYVWGKVWAVMDYYPARCGDALLTIQARSAACDTPAPLYMVLPQRWGCDWQEARLGVWHCKLGAGLEFPVVTEQGLYGLAKITNYWYEDPGKPLYGLATWQIPPIYPYMESRYFSRGFVEVATSLPSNDADGGLPLCDVVSVEGVRANPPHTRVKAGTLDIFGGCVIVQKGSSGLPPRVDYWRCTGEVETLRLYQRRSACRWAQIHVDVSGGHLVQDPDTLLWGMVDETTAEVKVAPRFAKLGAFSNHMACAWPNPHEGDPALCGLVDDRGVWMLAPRWKKIDPYSIHFFVAQDTDGHWGGLGRMGRVLVPFEPVAYWEIEAKKHGFTEPWNLDDTGQAWAIENFIRRQILRVGILAHWQEQVQLARAEPSLKRLEGIFDHNATTSMLSTARLFGLRVQLLEDVSSSLLKPKKGEVGTIGTSYPVDLGCFDLSVEVPVQGLASCPDAVLGISYSKLRVLESPVSAS